jgi:two-component system sensor histidine kinase/response regulator
MAKPVGRPRSSILVVDDRGENILALESVLKQLDQRVVTASSGEEALLRVLETDFAVILLDVQMPGMDGFETAAMIRQRERSRLTPIIFLTAAATDGDERVFKGYQQGAVDYILKPFSPEIMRSKVAVFVDLHQKTLELERQAEDLRRSNEALEQFAYVASHDLREPLRKMAGFSQLLQRRYAPKLEPDALRLIGEIVEGAGRMQNLVNDLLEFSRLGKPPETVPVDLAQVFETVIGNLGALIQENRAVITHDDLPKVDGDETQLLQLFQNLIANAVKFHGKDSPVVHIGARRDGPAWEFTVADNGIGIETRHQEQVFTLFKRLHSRDRFAGTGIGLAICKKVVESHGGRIWIESEHGRGTTFLFTLPEDRS